METFYFFIPLAVISAMGLIARENSFVENVRISDMLNEGKMSANEYHELASAGVAFIEVEFISFISVQETPIGWVCKQGISLDHPNAREQTVRFLTSMFPQGQPLFQDGTAGVALEWSLSQEGMEVYSVLAPIVGSEIILVLLGSTCYQFDGGIAVIQDTNLVSVFFLDNPNGYSFFSILGEERDNEIQFELPHNHILVVYGYVK